MYCHDLEVMSLNPGCVEPKVLITSVLSRTLLKNKSLMAKWLEQVSQWHAMYCDDVWHAMYCDDLEVMSLNPGQVELGVLSTSVLSRTWLINKRSLMIEWLEQVSQWREMYCHDLKVKSSNPGRVELGVLSTSVLSRTWLRNKRSGGHEFDWWSSG